MGMDVEGKGRSLIQGTGGAHEYQKNRELYPSFSRSTLELCQGCTVTVNRPTLKKPTSSTGRHSFVRVDELSPVAFLSQLCFLSRFTSTYLLCLTSTNTWSSQKSLSCPFLHLSFYPFFVTCSYVFLAVSTDFRIQFYLNTYFLFASLLLFRERFSISHINTLRTGDADLRF